MNVLTRSEEVEREGLIDDAICRCSEPLLAFD